MFRSWINQQFWKNRLSEWFKWLTHKGSYLSPPTGITCIESYWKSPPLLTDCLCLGCSNTHKRSDTNSEKSQCCWIIVSDKPTVDTMLIQSDSKTRTVMNGWIDRFKYLECLKCYIKYIFCYSEIVFAQFFSLNVCCVGGFCWVLHLKPRSLVENSGK